MDYGGTAAWLISFTLYVQRKNLAAAACPNWDRIYMTVCVLILQFNTDSYAVQCSRVNAQRPVLSCVDLQ